MNSQRDHFRAWIPACSLTAALLHRCFPFNLSTSTQGAIVKLRKLQTVLGYVGKRGWREGGREGVRGGKREGATERVNEQAGKSKRERWE